MSALLPSLSRYLITEANTRMAREFRNHLAQIREGLAELKGQHQPIPIAGLIERHADERERLYAAAFYAVVGRLPSEDEASGTLTDRHNPV